MPLLSPALQIAWQFGAHAAARLRVDYIETGHIVSGILSYNLVDANFFNDNREDHLVFQRERDCLYSLLESFKINIKEFAAFHSATLKPGKAIMTGNVVHRSPACKKFFKELETTGPADLTSMHFLALLLQVHDQALISYLSEKQVDITELAKELWRKGNLYPGFNLQNTPGQDHKIKYLAKFGRDLLVAAKEGKFSSFEGRKVEIQEIIKILGRRTKRNPILIGEPGVGKTAIIEELARQLHQGTIKAPALAGKRIIQISATDLVAGTKYRGEFEEKLQGIIKESLEDPSIIVFFDEFHSLMGAGSAEGSLDAINILKPILAGKETSCIAATTTGEYRKYIERDKALARRFSQVIIIEPTAAEAANILIKTKHDLEDFHQVIIPDETIATAVELSVRYMPDKCLPDKALDILDEACSALRNKITSSIIEAGKQELSAILPTLSEKYVIKVLSKKIKIPITQLSQNDAGKIIKLDVNIKETIKGQDKAIQVITNHLKISKAGIGNKNKPLGVFLFIGPTGVGKTLLAKALARIMFTSEDDLVRFDMSEYQEQHTISKLIGSPPGYIGYEHEGMLIRELRNHPYSVVLFDEIDKAHPRIMDLFLQLFDEGRITDNKGRFVDGRNAVFIMTSNQFNLPKHIGFKNADPDTPQDEILKAVQVHFRREFINRIDKIIPFNSLGQDAIESIIRLKLDELVNLLISTHQVSITYTDDVINFILTHTRYKEFGAREIERLITDQIKELLSDFIISSMSDNIPMAGKRLQITFTEGNVRLICQ